MNNPLLQPIIHKKIRSYLDKETWKCLRLSCKECAKLYQSDKNQLIEEYNSLPDYSSLIHVGSYQTSQCRIGLSSHTDIQDPINIYERGFFQSHTDIQNPNNIYKQGFFHHETSYQTWHGLTCLKHGSNRQIGLYHYGQKHGYWLEIPINFNLYMNPAHITRFNHGHKMEHIFFLNKYRSYRHPTPIVESNYRKLGNNLFIRTRDTGYSRAHMFHLMNNHQLDVIVNDIWQEVGCIGGRLHMTVIMDYHSRKDFYEDNILFVRFGMKDGTGEYIGTLFQVDLNGVAIKRYKKGLLYDGSIVY